VRRALEVCRLAAQAAEREELSAVRGGGKAPSHVSLGHIDEAVKQLRGSCVQRAVIALPPQQLLILACAVSQQSRTGRAEVDVHALAAQHGMICEQYASLHAPSESEQNEMVARLCCSRLLAPAAVPGAIRLVVAADDVKRALQDHSDKPWFANFSGL